MIAASFQGRFALGSILALVLASFAGPLVSPAAAQTPATPAGFERVDDMLLPKAPATRGLSGPASVTAASFTPWPGGLVPIEFASGISEANQQAVFAACAIWSKRASVSCVPHTSEVPYLRVTASGGGCYATVGSYAGRDPARMNLDVSCWAQKSILHELGHVFGLQHEHQRPDRDAYITIDMSAVDPAYTSAFSLLTGAPTRGAYDFLSVMHYHDFAFAAQPLTRTMLPKPGFEWYTYSLGSSDFPSPGDGDAVQAIYGGGAPYWPARVQNLRLAPNGGPGVRVDWDPPTGAPQVTQYWIMVFAGQNYLESSVLQTFNVGPESTGVTLDLQPGHYFLTVKGDSADGEYARSTVFSFSVGANGGDTVSQSPGAPTLDAAAAGPDRVALTWRPGAGVAPTMYTIYAGTTPGSSNLGSFPVGTTTSVVTAAPAGATTYIRVVASNQVGAATSNEVSFYVPGNPGPGSPTLSITSLTNPVALSWTPGAPGASYTVVAGTAPGASNLARLPLGAARSLMANAPAGVPIYVRVLATTPAGTVASNEVRVQVPGAWEAQAPALGAPEVRGRTVQLAWSGSNATSYTLIARPQTGGRIIAAIPVGRLTAISIPNVPSGAYLVTVAAAPGYAESNPTLVVVP